MKAPRNAIGLGGLLDLFDDLAQDLDADLLNGFVVCLDLFDSLENGIGDTGVAQFGDAFDDLIALDGHEAGDDGDGCKELASILGDVVSQPGLVCLVGDHVICELGHDEIGSCGDLVFQIR